MSYGEFAGAAFRASWLAVLISTAVMTVSYWIFGNNPLQALFMPVWALFVLATTGVIAFVLANIVFLGSRLVLPDSAVWIAGAVFALTFALFKKEYSQLHVDFLAYLLPVVAGAVWYRNAIP